MSSAAKAAAKAASKPAATKIVAKATKPPAKPITAANLGPVSTDGHEVKDIQSCILSVLNSAPSPMRAIDIVVALSKEYGISAERSTINKILYGGPFETTEKEGAAPLWKARRVEAAETRKPTLRAAGFEMWISPGLECAEKVIRASLKPFTELTDVVCDLTTAEGQLASEIVSELGLDAEEKDGEDE